MEVLNDEDDEDSYDDDACDDYCDSLYEERRERELFGDRW